jgi:hypothetical protein
MENPFETNRLPTTEDLNPEGGIRERLILVAEDSPTAGDRLHLQQAGYGGDGGDERR